MDLIPRLLHRRNPYEQGLVVNPGNQYNFDPAATFNAVKNIGKNTLDYINEEGDFARPVKWQKTENKSALTMDNDQTMALDDGGGTAEASKTGASNGVGFRGKLTGNTQSHYGYEKHYHERVEAHSLQIRSWFFTWGISKWSKATNIGDRIDILRSWSRPGLVYALDEDIWNSTANYLNAFMPFQQSKNAITDNIYGNALNFYVGDFFDNKVLNDPLSSNTKKGVLNQYRKIRLKSFTITITPRTFKQNTCEANPWLFRKAEDEMVPFRANQSFSAYKHITDTDPGELFNQDYWIYRDIYGYYQGNDGIIPSVPKDSFSTSTTEDSIPRTVHRLRAFDNQVEIMNNEKPFSFTRVLNPQGAYYLSPQNIWDNRKKPIANLVNELEGQTGLSTGSMINKFPEYFNCVFAPINPPMKIAANIIVSCKTDGTVTKYGIVPMVNVTTELHVKFQATWEALDFDHITIPITYSNEIIYDPLFKAETDYKIETGQTYDKIILGIN